MLKTVSTLCATLALCGAAHAQQNLFRCGNTYQDRPCASEAGKVIGKGGAPARESTPAAASVDLTCTRRGARAQKIMWAREAGATAETQLATVATPAERKLIADVYDRRGSSVDVRAAVEADCSAEMARNAQAAALMEAAAKLQGQDAPAVAARGSAVEPSAREDAERDRQASNAHVIDTRNNRQQCASLAAQRERILERQRAGGSSTTMDALNRQRQDTDKALRAAGC